MSDFYAISGTLILLQAVYNYFHYKHKQRHYKKRCPYCYREL